MIAAPLPLQAHADTADSIVFVRGLRKVYQSYATPGGEMSGLFLWLRQLHQAVRLTAAPPRTVVALDGIDLDIQRGEIVGLMGPNGAGKTTLIKILCGLLDPSRGEARVAGHDVVHDRLLVKRSASYVSTTGWMGLEWALTVEENLRLYARLFGVPGARAGAVVAEALASVDLEVHARKHVYQLSSGMRQRVVLARALLVATPLVFLDEPTVGLDPVTARDIRQVVKHELNARRGQTVVITSHVAAELDRLCDRVGILLGGQLIVMGTVAELCRVVADRTVVELRVSGLTPESLDAVRGVAGVLQVSSTLHAADAGRLRLHLASEQPLDRVLDVLRARGTAVRWVGSAPAGLEDAYLAYTGAARE